MKSTFRISSLAVGAAATVMLLAACTSGGGSNGTESAAPEAAFEPPSRVTAIVHTGPGGGGDLLAREVIAMLETEELISPGSWIVENAEGGNSAVALGTLNRAEGDEETIAFMSNIWMTNQMVTEGVEFGTLDFTPVTSLVEDTYVIGVKADSPINDLDDLMAAAEDAGGNLVQSGGSTTAIDAQMGTILQQEGDVSWRYVPFASGGERKTAVVRGDAQFFITETGDLSEEVAAGEWKIIAVLGDAASEVYPDVETSVEQGFTEPLPQMLRGVIMPAGVSEDAVNYYADTFAKLLETPSWADYLERNGARTSGLGPVEYRETLEIQYDTFLEYYENLGVLVLNK